MDLKSLYEAHLWFQLLESLLLAADPPMFDTAVVAAAFRDDVTADRMLRIIAEVKPDSWDAREATRLLGQVRLRRELHQRDAGSQPPKLRRIVQGGHLYVPATINGHKVN